MQCRTAFLLAAFAAPCAAATTAIAPAPVRAVAVGLALSPGQELSAGPPAVEIPAWAPGTRAFETASPVLSGAPAFEASAAVLGPALPAAPILEREPVTTPSAPRRRAARTHALSASGEGEEGAPGVSKPARAGLLAARTAAGAAFDGAKLEASGWELPPYLDAADPRHRRAMLAIVAAAQGSPSARKVLREAAAAARTQGHPLVFEFTALRRQEGHLNWNSGIMRLSSRYLREKARRAVPLLIHELKHWVQFASGLPPEAFELELEAYLYMLKAARELDVEFRSSDVLWEGEERLAKGVTHFIRLIHGQAAYKDLTIVGTGRGAVDALVGHIFEEINGSEYRLEAYRKALRGRQATYARMRREGYAADLLENYREGQLQPLRAKIQFEEGARSGFFERVDELFEPGPRRRLRRFVRRVMAMAERTRRELKRGRGT